MDNSIYVSLSRQLTLFRNLEVTANNIANVNTVGYNAERLAFDDYMVREKTSDDREKIAFANDPFSYRDTTNGRVEKTGNPLDVAINGPGYFQIQTPLGTRYTKAGNFQLNNEGSLVTIKGEPVLDAGGSPIVIPPDAGDLEILGSGTIRSNGQEIGTIGVVEFENEGTLERVGDTMFKTDQQGQPSLQSKVMQGHIELSNVNGVNEMVRLLQLQRSSGSTAKFIETMYDLERKTSSAYTRTSQS